MRGTDERSGSLFSYVDLETRVPKSHPLRTIREIVNGALSNLSAVFEAMYAPLGRPSIAPEKLLRASLLQAFYSIRSERQLMERLEFDLLFRWFVGLGIDDPVWDHSVFSKNRDRLLEGDVAAKFMAAVLTQPNVKQLLSSEHFSVDGTLVEAWASMKSLKPKNEDRGDDPPASGGRNQEVNFRGETRSNQTHISTSDPDAMLYRKGAGMEAKLCFIGHVLTLQLLFPFQMSAPCFSLVCASPERPRNDVRGLDTALCEFHGDAADFLHRPSDQEWCFVRRGGSVFLSGMALVR